MKSRAHATWLLPMLLPFAAVACDMMKPKADAADAAPPPAASAPPPAAVTTTTPPAATTPAAPARPGQPTAPHAQATDGGKPAPLTLPEGGLPGIPSGLAIPSALPSGWPVPSGIPTVLPSGIPTVLPSGLPQWPAPTASTKK